MSRGPIIIDTKGMDEILRRFEMYAVDTDRAIERALTTAVRSIAENADEMVPEDEGHLKASQDVVDPHKRGDTYIAEITYGGPSAPYALVQHENEDLWHPPKPPAKRKVGGRSGMGPTAPGDRTNGGPKYLEYPFDRETETWPLGFKDRLVAAGWRLLTE